MDNVIGEDQPNQGTPNFGVTVFGEYGTRAQFCELILETIMFPVLAKFREGDRLVSRWAI